MFFFSSCGNATVWHVDMVLLLTFIPFELIMLNIFCSCIFLAFELVFQLIEADEDKKSPGVLQLQITVLLTAGAAQ